MAPPETSEPTFWDRRYQQGSDGWELGGAALPIARFLAGHPLAPKPPGRVLVPGCGRGHEAALLAGLGFAVLGVDFSGEALAGARRLHGEGAIGEAGGSVNWLQADLFNPGSLAQAGLGPLSLAGVVEHTCFCAINPERRPAYVAMVQRLLAPDGWLLGLFWCLERPGGPPWGSEPGQLADQWHGAGFTAHVWEPAFPPTIDRGGQPREREWLGFWHRAVPIPEAVQPASGSRP